MLNINNYCVKHGTKFTLGPLSFSLVEGITCLVGANGAGKTTLFNALVGIQKRKSGEIINAKNISIGYLPQNIVLPANARCIDLLIHICIVYNVHKNVREEYSIQALNAVNLTEEKNTKIKKLSGGMKQRLGIACAIVNEPELILLDEPTVGLDPKQRIDMRNLITKIAKENTVLLSTHLLEDVDKMANNVLILNKGKLVFSDNITKLRAEPGTFEEVISKYMNNNTS